MDRFTSRFLRRHALPALRRVRQTFFGALALGGAWSLGACGGAPSTSLQRSVATKSKGHAASAALTEVRLNAPRQVGHAHGRGPAAVGQAARLVVLGDSISAGAGASSAAMSYASLLHRNVDAFYPGHQGEDLVARFGPQLAFYNGAVIGETTDGILHRQLPRLRKHLFSGEQSALRGHTVVVLTAGGNNLRRELGPGGSLEGATFAAALQDLEEVFGFFNDPQRFPDGVTLYFSTIYDMTDGTDSAHLCISGLRFAGLSHALQQWKLGYLALADNFNRILAAGEGAQLQRPTLRVVPIDAHRSFLGHGFNYAVDANDHHDRSDPTLWLSEQDCIHPNNRGHHELRRAFYRAITGRRP